MRRAAERARRRALDHETVGRARRPPPRASPSCSERREAIALLHAQLGRAGDASSRRPRSAAATARIGSSSIAAGTSVRRDRGSAQRRAPHDQIRRAARRLRRRSRSIDVGAHAPQDREHARCASGSGRRRASAQLRAGHDRRGDEEERRRREVAGERDVGRAETLSARRRRPCRPRARERDAEVRAAGARYGRGSGAARVTRVVPRARSPASRMADFTCALATGSVQSMAVEPAARARVNGARPSVVSTRAPMARSGSATRSIGRRRSDASPSSVRSVPRAPATRPAPRRIVVPELRAVERACAVARPGSSPAPSTRTTSPVARRPSRRARAPPRASRRTSAPPGEPVHRRRPVARARRGAARDARSTCRPAPSTSPRRPAVGGRDHARRPSSRVTSEPSPHRRGRRRAPPRAPHASPAASSDSRRPSAVRKSSSAVAMRGRVRQRDVAPQLGAARRDARGVAEAAAGVVEHADARRRARSATAVDQRIRHEVRQMRYAREDLVVASAAAISSTCAPTPSQSAAHRASAVGVACRAVGVRMQRRPRNRSARAAPAPDGLAAGDRMRAHHRPGSAQTRSSAATRLAFTLPTSVSSVPGATCGRKRSASAAHAPTGAARTTTSAPATAAAGLGRRRGRRSRARAPRAGSRRCARSPTTSPTRPACARRQRERPADEADAGDRSAGRRRGVIRRRAAPPSSASTKRWFSSGRPIVTRRCSGKP